MPDLPPRPFDPDAALALMIENQAEYWLYRARVAGWAHGTQDGLSWYRSGQPSAELNAIVRAQVAPEGDPSAAIVAARERVSPEGQPWTWWDPPAEVERLLPAAGLRLTSQDTAMAANLARMSAVVEAPAALTIARVRDDAGALEWRLAFRAAHGQAPNAPETPDQRAAVLRGFAPAGYGDDEPLRLYLARLAGGSVAVAQLFVGAGVAGIYCVATLPRARRQGIGAAVTHAALDDARLLGYHMAVLGATELGAGVYRRLGFAAYGVMTEYVWEPD